MFAVCDPVNFFDAVKLNGKKFDCDEMTEDEGGAFAMVWRRDGNFRWTSPLRSFDKLRTGSEVGPIFSDLCAKYLLFRLKPVMQCLTGNPQQHGSQGLVAVSAF